MKNILQEINKHFRNFLQNIQQQIRCQMVKVEKGCGYSETGRK